MSGLNYLKLGSTLSNICNATELNATTPSKISGENPAYHSKLKEMAYAKQGNYEWKS